MKRAFWLDANRLPKSQPRVVGGELELKSPVMLVAPPPEKGEIWHRFARKKNPGPRVPDVLYQWTITPGVIILTSLNLPNSILHIPGCWLVEPHNSHSIASHTPKLDVPVWFVMSSKSSKALDTMNSLNVCSCALIIQNTYTNVGWFLEVETDTHWLSTWLYLCLPISYQKFEKHALVYNHGFEKNSKSQRTYLLLLLLI